MAQIFSADAQVSATSTALTGTAETTIVSTLNLQVPLETAKAKVIAVVPVTPGSDATKFTLKLYRNPVAGGVAIATMELDFAAATGKQIGVIAVTDFVASSQAVAYSVTVTQGGGTANGSVPAGAYIEGTLISG